MEAVPIKKQIESEETKLQLLESRLKRRKLTAPERTELALKILRRDLPVKNLPKLAEALVMSH